MPKKAKNKRKKKVDTNFAHNPRYCMIMPDAVRRDDEDIAPTGQS